MIEDTRRIKKEIISIAALCCFIPMVAYAAPYKPAFIEDLSTVERLDENIDLGDKVIDLSISYQTSNGQIPSALYRSHSPENIKGWIRHSWPIFKRFLAQHNIPTTDCRRNYNLNMFVVTPTIMDERDRFEEAPWSADVVRGKNDRIYGYYTATKEIKNNSTILVTDWVGHRENVILVHEMTHYWYDRMCIRPHWNGSSEHFARAFQSYYEMRAP
jgi:hypothetical protein